MGRPGARLGLAGLALAASACDPGSPAARVPLECERLAFVPSGRSEPFSDVTCRAWSDLLVDRFEVTRELWRAVAEAAPGEVAELDGRFGQDWSRGSPWVPAVAMDLAEARDFARARGMRLPTVGEWMYVAGGSGAQLWPRDPRSKPEGQANTLEVGLGRLAPVGSFPNGQTIGTNVHDLIGNTWEWTLPPLPRGVVPSSWRGPGDSPYPIWAMGGSYLTEAEPLFDARQRSFHAWGLEPGHRAVDLGLRCIVEAEPFLARRASAWSDPAHRERVVAVGHLWGRRAVALLESMTAREDAPAALGWLLEGARQ